MSEIKFRIQEYQSALRRYLKNNNLQNAGVPLIGALHDLKIQMDNLDFPVCVGIFEILPGMSSQFFKDNWEKVIVPESKLSIMLTKGWLPTSYLEMHAGILYLRVNEYTENLENKIYFLISERGLKVVHRRDSPPCDKLPISGVKETALDELFGNYNK